MKVKDIKIGSTYRHKRRHVKILSEKKCYNGRTHWVALNLATQRVVTIKSAVSLIKIPYLD